MRSRILYWTQPTDIDNGFCLSQTPGAAGALTFTGSLVTAGVGKAWSGDPTAYAGGCSQRRIRVTCAGDETGKTMLLVGTRAAADSTIHFPSSSRVAITETLALGTAGTYDTAQDFAELTAAPVISAAAAGAIKVGTSPVGSTPWVQPSESGKSPDNVMLVIILESGAVNFGIEHTGERIPGPNAVAGAIPRVLPHSVIVAKSASIDGNYAFAPQGFRLKINSGTGLLRYSYRQAGVL